MSLIYIVRHGNTFDTGDVIRRVGGRTDLALSVSGHAQAERLAQNFAQITFGQVYASKLKRQVETAQAILKAQQSPPNIETLEFLREIDYGPDENKAEAEVLARIGDGAMINWDTHARPPQGWDVDPCAIRQSWTGFFKAQRGAEHPVLLVTSNGIARFILDVATHKDDMPRKLRTGAYGVIDPHGETAHVISWDRRPN